MFGLHATFTLSPGHEEAFDELARDTAGRVLDSEPGTLVYAVCRDESRPQVRVFLEIYRDAASFHAHESQPYVQQFLAARGLHLAAEVAVDWLEVAEPAIAPARPTATASVTEERS